MQSDYAWTAMLLPFQTSKGITAEYHPAPHPSSSLAGPYAALCITVTHLIGLEKRTGKASGARAACVSCTPRVHVPKITHGLTLKLARCSSHFRVAASLRPQRLKRRYPLKERSKNFGRPLLGPSQGLPDECM